MSARLLSLAVLGGGEERLGGVGEFEACWLDLAENSTVVYPGWEAGGSSYA
jgi:hypothetical protein